MHRILVIGERPDQAKALAFRLGLLGMEASAGAAELTLAVRAIFTYNPQVILIDVSSSEKSRELFTFLYETSVVPLVVLGDDRDQDDIIWYLEKGAADYISRAVSANILAARIAAIIRRFDVEHSNGVLTIGSLEVDTERHQVSKGGRTIQLTPTEFAILRTLAENAGKPCKHSMILERVWGEDFRQCSHYLRLYIGYLRQKLEDNPKKPRILLTEWGVGYRLVPDKQHGRQAVTRSPRPVSA